MKKSILGIFLAFGIGVFCRLTDIPLPAPPALVGALLVCCMTLGFMFGQKYLSKEKNNVT